MACPFFMLACLLPLAYAQPAPDSVPCSIAVYMVDVKALPTKFVSNRAFACSGVCSDHEHPALRAVNVRGLCQRVGACESSCLILTGTYINGGCSTPVIHLATGHYLVVVSTFDPVDAGYTIVLQTSHAVTVTRRR
jgi:hypothetical protein